MADIGRTIFVTGMYRSGTTLVARLINAHSRIIFVSDVLLEYFKAIRNALTPEGDDRDASRPLEDYFLADQSLNQRIQAASFDVPLAAGESVRMIGRIKNYAQSYSPRFVDLLEDRDFDNFRSCGAYLFQQIAASDPKPEAAAVGFKETWAEAFAAPFLNELGPVGRALFLVRDPRAVIASSFRKKEHKYPLIFLIRQWRKSVCFARLCADIVPEYCERSLLMRYEDVVGQPATHIPRIIELAGVPMEPSVLNPSQYTDGAGQPWRQNTVYTDGGQGFNTGTIDRWRENLPEEVIRYIEFACLPEMQWLGYEPTTSIDTVPQGYPPDDPDSIAPWILNYYPRQSLLDKNWGYKIHREECDRHELWTQAGSKGAADISADAKRNYFIDERYFDHLNCEGSYV